MRGRDDEALAPILHYEAASTTGGDDTCGQHLDNHWFSAFNLDYLSLMLDNHFLALGSHFVEAPNLLISLMLPDRTLLQK